ncbi:MAG: ATP-dependent zinc protease [Deltaproteobacteria bacterium]|nr:ATP-dependent zinc protease [Deltaproteobacteria bacterium]
MLRGDFHIVGWQELAIFPEWKNAKMKAKVDTGAASSAIHAEEYQILHLPGTHDRPLNEEIKMKLKIGTVANPKFIWAHAPIVDYRNVKNSGGKIEERPFIETKILIGGLTHSIILSVTNREKMKFPVLLGRSFLANKFLVDSGSKKLL